jgi:hypothetical protein
LTSALDGGEWSASRPGRFTPRERAPGTHWIGGRVGPRAVLDAVVKRKIPTHGEIQKSTKLLGIISVDLNVIDQILEKKWEYNGIVHQLFIDS